MVTNDDTLINNVMASVPVVRRCSVDVQIGSAQKKETPFTFTSRMRTLWLHGYTDNTWEMLCCTYYLLCM